MTKCKATVADLPVALPSYKYIVLFIMCLAAFWHTTSNCRVKISHILIFRGSTILWHVAEWIGRCNQGQTVWGWFFYNCLAHLKVPIAVTGTWWNKKFYLVTQPAISMRYILPKKMGLLRCEFLYQWRWSVRRVFEYLCCSVTLGLRKDIPCHVKPYPFLSLQITKADIRPQLQYAVNLGDCRWLL